ncbi:MAG TPA: SRPBCC domain-containing protein [Gemmatimonadales bacterium]|nr:SRPBCC domain-containing protein [Gemmatimonadales bacterium]
MASTRVSRRLDAPRAAVYRALLDPPAVATWKVPTGMTNLVHAFEAREGGCFRVSRTYEESTGKTTAHRHLPRPLREAGARRAGRRGVEFETAAPALRGKMTITITLADAPGGGWGTKRPLDGRGGASTPGPAALRPRPITAG